MANRPIVVIEGLEQLSRRLQSKIISAIKYSPSSPINKIGQDLIEDIRLGKDPYRERDFTPLAESTIRNRERLAMANPTHPAFQASKSNLTLTGQLVSSLKIQVKRSEMAIRIFASGVHKRYKNLSGRVSRKKKGSKNTTNDELALWHSQGSGNLPKRSLLYISDQRLEKWTGWIKEFLYKNLTL
jgi:hypothetical protein